MARSTCQTVENRVAAIAQTQRYGRVGCPNSRFPGAGPIRRTTPRRIARISVLSHSIAAGRSHKGSCRTHRPGGFPTPGLRLTRDSPSGATTRSAARQQMRVFADPNWSLPCDVGSVRPPTSLSGTFTALGAWKGHPCCFSRAVRLGSKPIQLPHKSRPTFPGCVSRPSCGRARAFLPKPYIPKASSRSHRIAWSDSAYNCCSDGG